MAEQLPLDLPHRPALGRSAFFVSHANALALAEIDRWPDWPLARLALIGPKGSGKTHLVHVWAGLAGATICSAGELPPPDAPPVPTAVEGVEAVLGDPAAEERLFHLLNAYSLGKVPVLLTGRDSPARWPVALPDLRSRLSGTHLATLKAPDDELLAALYVKHFGDRQLHPTRALVHYLVAHGGRSAQAVAETVAALDRAQLASGRKLSPKLAGEVLDKGRTPSP